MEQELILQMMHDQYKDFREDGMNHREASEATIAYIRSYMADALAMLIGSFVLDMDGHDE